MTNDSVEEYSYRDSEPTWSNHYLWEHVVELLAEYSPTRERVFEIGCGNGATANMLGALGYEVTGIDPSQSGIAIANKHYSRLRLFVGDAYDNLAGKYGTYPIVVSLEVVEHCYYPRKFAKAFYDLLEEGGLGLISTPYHGYMKNVALAVLGKMDAHYTALWDGGHVKFFSELTLRKLLEEVGFRDIQFRRVGRIPPFAKSMIAIVRK